MNHCTLIGIDTAKHSFALHGADADGATCFRKTLRRNRVLAFLKQQPPCLVALECCGGSHYWARAIQQLGHEVKLLPAAYVKPYVKRQKNDANDAAAIVEAACRASMRGVAVKSREAQAHASLYRTRALYVRQRTQTANAIRSHLLEFGIICGKGFAALEKVRVALADGTLETPEPFPTMVQELLATLFEHIDQLTRRIDASRVVMDHITETNVDAQRFQTVPGVGPITAFALLAFAGDLAQFKNGREFAAWLGLTPREHSTGGRQQLGGITKLGQRDLRSLLVQGAMTVYRQRNRRFHSLPLSLQRIMTEKHPKVVGVAWANRNARILWALHHHQEDYDPAKYHRGAIAHHDHPTCEA